MIPLPQQFMGGPHVVPPPTEPEPETGTVVAEAFAMLMEPPAELVTDAAAMLAVPLIPRPQPASQPLAAETQVLHFAATPLSALASTSPAPLTDPQHPIASLEPGRTDIVAPGLPPAPIQTVTDPEVQTASAAIQLADPAEIAVKVQAVAAPQLPLSPKANAGENAFLTRLETKADLPSPFPMPQPAEIKSPLTTVPVVGHNSAKGTPERPIDPDDVSDQVAGQVLPKKVLPDIVASPAINIANVARPEPILVVDKVHDGLVAPDLQAVIPGGPDRAQAPLSTTPAPMPASVPATLIARAPDAALGPVEVVLDPKELGKIRFEIHQQGDQIKVFLAVERPETLDLLRRHADQLIQEFRAAGFAGASLGFGQWGGQRGSTAGETATTEPEASLAEPSMPMPKHSPNRNFVPVQGLNLRL